MYTIIYEKFSGEVIGIQKENMSIPIDAANGDFAKFLEWNAQQPVPLDWKTGLGVYVPTTTEKWNSIVLRASELERKCDWTQLPDSGLSISKQLEWQAYRGDLRSIQDDFATPDDVIFPDPPAEE